MLLKVDRSTAVVFDLDDTLYRERDFVESGFRAVLDSIGRAGDPQLLGRMWEWQRAGEPVMAKLAETEETSHGAQDLLNVYRFHTPDIALREGALRLLTAIRRAGGAIALITDGRSRTQRAKIAALGLHGVFDVLVVSEEVGTEKPHINNYAIVRDSLKHHRRFVLIADNPRKDFVTPNGLSWVTVQLDDDGTHVHSQALSGDADYQASLHVQTLMEIRVQRQDVTDSKNHEKCHR